MKLILALFIVGHSVFSTATLSYAQTSSSKLTAELFYEKLKGNRAAAVIDVRTPEEFANGYIADAVNIDYNNDNFSSKIDALDKTKTYYVYCLSGGRSNSALEYMVSHGFTSVYELKGGILKWNYPLVQPASSAERDPGMSVEEYNKLVASDDIVLIDFYAPWCGPCKKMAPMFEDISKTYSGRVKVIKINIDKNNQLIKDLGIEEIPVVKTFHKGKETWSNIGLVEKSTLIKALGI